MALRVELGRVREPWWDDRDVYVVCGGPSLAGYDLSRLRERGHVLGVNRAADLIPVDATFTLDRLFLQRRRVDLERWAREHEVYGAVGSDYNDDPIPGVTYLERVQSLGLSRDRGRITNGLNSGFGALNLVYHKRARVVYVLGLDLQAHDPREPSHWHGGYDWNKGSAIKYYGRWSDRFAELAADFEKEGVRVYNANPDSAVRWFPFTSYEELGL